MSLYQSTPRIFLGLSLLFFFWCHSSGCLVKHYLYQLPMQRGDGLLTGSLREVGLPVAPIERMVRKTREGGYPNIHSILLIKDGKLVLEEYFHGYRRDTKHDLRSTTKSITSLLVGMALDKQIFRHRKQLVAPMLPTYQSLLATDPKKKTIQLEHLLTMSSGLACNDWVRASPGQEDKMYKSPDWLRFLFKVPMAATPGKRFSYCTGGVIALGAALAHQSRMPVPTFAKRHLFGPLGIRDVKWSPARPKGVVDTGGHLYMRPRDMAKLGLLVLQKGRWKGRPVVSEGWIRKMLTPRWSRVGYGYLWWRKVAANRETKTRIVMHHTSGNGGQYIFVMPALKMVAVFTGGNYHSPAMKLPFLMLGKHVFRPMLQTKKGQR